MISELLGHAEHAHGHAVFGHGIRDVILKPNGSHAQRGRDVEDVRRGGFEEMRKSDLRAEKSPPSVDLVHQIVSAERGVGEVSGGSWGGVRLRETATIIQSELSECHQFEVRQEFIIMYDYS